MVAGLSWRRLRNLTPKQRSFCDALTCQGRYSGLREHHGTAPATPRILYGGAGYGGKTHALLSATMELNTELARLGFPGQYGMLLTRTYKQAQMRHILEMSKPWDTGYDSTDRFLEYGYMTGVTDRIHGLAFHFHEKALGGFLIRNIDDPGKYRGSQVAWALVDELTENTRDDFDAILYTIRGGRLPIKAFGAATNPDGIGHSFCKKLWIEQDFEDEEMMDPRDFVYIPALPQDNPTFDETVAATLAGTSDPLLRKARWEGSWDLNLAARFAFTEGVHKFTTDEFLRAIRHEPGDNPWFLIEQYGLPVYGSLDYGTSERSGSPYYLHVLDDASPVNIWTMAELYMKGQRMPQQASAIHALERRTAVPKRRYADPSLWGRIANDETKTSLTRSARFRELGLRLTQGINDRIEGWETMDQLLWYERGPDGTLSTRPRWRIHESCKNLLRALGGAPRDKHNPEDVDTDYDLDHALDSVRYFLHTHLRGKSKRRQEAPAGSPRWYREQLERRIRRGRRERWD